MYTSQLPGMGPFAIRYPRGRGSLVDWRNVMQEQPVGRGRKLSDGDQLALLTLGPLGNDVARVVARLRERGISVGHYDMIYLKPLDETLVAEAAGHYRHVVTVEDGTTMGGLGTAVAEWMARNGSAARLTTLGVNDTFVQHGKPGELYAQCGIDEQSIERTIIDLLNQTSPR